ncbi:MULTISPECIES: cellulose biosynthesis protein BcsN [Mesorhizobium]|uniref:cellulose biosynthesis protein BcsN n=1 Tax=Mesorhizobium TaxID=68287 RepID=UPI0009C18457|nr:MULTISPECIES: cellulose biosynthesis protein BcsN [Mesorhizobium]QKC70059.1 cellulose biosynthesis protein BcsN [Mesorhizobium loti]
MDFAWARPICLFARKPAALNGDAALSCAGVASVAKAIGQALVLMLAGCAQPPPLVHSTGTSLVASETAFALPAPGGPAVTAVLERRFANATQQEILLSTSAHTPGQNMLRVQMFGPVDAAAAGESRLREGYLPLGNIGSEIRQALPGIRMQTSPYYVQNKYGPFGYAAGRSASGDTCLYAWQRISSTGITQTWIGNKGSIQVRLRICDQNEPEQKLLEVMYGYTITSSFKTRNWNPYGEPPAPEASLGKPGQPIYPVGVARFETVTSPQATPRPRLTALSPRQVVAEPLPVLPAPVGPIVPPPPGSSAITPAQSTLVPSPPPVPSKAADKPAAPIVPPPPCAAADGSGTCN